MRLTVTDVVEAVSQLVSKGYDGEYRIEDGHLVDLVRNLPVNPKGIHVDIAIRLESESGIGEASNIYAISDRKTHRKDLLIDAFDLYDQICNCKLNDQLVDNRSTRFIDDSVVPTHYGLRKIYKTEFEGDPERYVLRIGFPDFPECPFGESYSMLGFDTAEQVYVRLVTSILRDPRLNRVPYQGLEVPDNE